jgi:hypothetical protein
VVNRLHLIPAAVVLFFLGSAGCLLLLKAGRDYTGGRLDTARRRARRGGFLMCAGDAALALAAALVTPTGAALAAAAGFTALLAGLSGKPRPSGELAALLHVAAGAWILFVA